MQPARVNPKLRATPPVSTAATLNPAAINLGTWIIARRPKPGGPGQRSGRRGAGFTGSPLRHCPDNWPRPCRLRKRPWKQSTKAGATWTGRGSGDDRNLNAAINLRNLIMPAGRSRDGPGQEAMGQQAVASRQGSRHVFRQQVPPRRGSVNAAWSGTVVEGRRGTRITGT